VVTPLNIGTVQFRSLIPVSRGEKLKPGQLTCVVQYSPSFDTINTMSEGANIQSKVFCIKRIVTSWISVGLPKSMTTSMLSPQ